MKAALMVCALALGLAGCSEYSRQDRAVGGAVIGGGTGALIGAAATGSGTGALVGGLIGAGTGAIIGAETTPRACWARDSYGNRYRVQCP
ncbi:glycine zipper domain-containing protein [Xanthobacter autotrophicus]|uniref:Bacteriocin n=1 Tax=Xanthobacter autotrophicus TaxID=280 RepID=A0A6C1KD85_XANAU|nr:glycine zipper domain-containing protein [Xanthobacter autotrophicus]TLX41781.1 bacteriocin [Xanthobacter autotrophicus]